MSLGFRIRERLKTFVKVSCHENSKIPIQGVTISELPVSFESIFLLSRPTVTRVDPGLRLSSLVTERLDCQTKSCRLHFGCPAGKKLSLESYKPLSTGRLVGLFVPVSDNILLESLLGPYKSSSFDLTQVYKFPERTNPLFFIYLKSFWEKKFWVSPSFYL